MSVAALRWEHAYSGGNTPTVSRTADPSKVIVRSAVGADAAAIHRLIADHAAEGRLLPRTVADIAAHIDQFAVATVADDEYASCRVKSAGPILACAAIAPLSSSVAEVRSLVVDSSARALGLGRRLLDELTTGARLSGFDTVCAFTHSPGYFVQRGFSLVPHAWLPEKIERDCRNCSSFRRCGQSAVVLPLAASRCAGRHVEAGRDVVRGHVRDVYFGVSSVNA